MARPGPWAKVVAAVLSLLAIASVSVAFFILLYRPASNGPSQPLGNPRFDKPERGDELVVVLDDPRLTVVVLPEGGGTRHEPTGQGFNWPPERYEARGA